MSLIPGISFVPADEATSIALKLPSFKTIIKVPEAHIFGNCRNLGDLEYKEKLYEGNFGKVYKCRDNKNGMVYAVKKYIFTQEMKYNGIPKFFLDEICVLKVLKHDNLVNLHEVIAGIKLETNLLLLDYCVISLQDLIDKKCDKVYERDVVKYIIRQLCDGLSYIHESLIMHRNISCRNLLFTSYGTLKISGFRTATFCKPDGMSFIESELAYRAPEILLRTNYTQNVDVWSAGCVLAHLLLKKLLFTGNSEEALLKSIFRILGCPTEAIWPGFNDISKKLKKEVLDPVPYSNIKNILTGVPEASSILLQDWLIYNPPVRMKASDVLKSHYILDTPPECSPQKMRQIIMEAALTAKLLDMMEADP